MRACAHEDEDEDSVRISNKCPCFSSCSASVFSMLPESMQCGYDDRGNSVPKILLLMKERLYSQDGLKAAHCTSKAITLFLFAS